MFIVKFAALREQGLNILYSALARFHEALGLGEIKVRVIFGRRPLLRVGPDVANAGVILGSESGQNSVQSGKGGTAFFELFDALEFLTYFGHAFLDVIETRGA